MTSTLRAVIAEEATRGTQTRLDFCPTSITDLLCDFGRITLPLIFFPLLKKYIDLDNFWAFLRAKFYVFMLIRC